MSRHFPEALVSGHEHRVANLTNDPKDRHVLAAAIEVGASRIITSNVKDFPDLSLAPWNLVAQHPDDFLLELLNRDQECVLSKLEQQARTLGRSVPELLRTLHAGVPAFASTARVYFS